MTALTTARTAPLDAVRLSTRFGVAFGVCQIATMIAMSIFVLPHGGPPGLDYERGRAVHDAADLYRAGNYVFMVSGVLLLGFLGAVSTRLRRIETSGTLATVAVAAGAVLAFVWPFAGVLHDVALDTGDSGADLRILAAWDSVAPYSLAFSALPRLFFVGALVLALRHVGTTPWLVRAGNVILVLSAAGTATVVSGAMFPLLALSTLGFELWIVALAVTWLREPTRTGAVEARR
ncbi:hypothetical protein [Nocardioides sp. CER19]|uniref:hypothetical protein n=1 Tax=Nocardioides sp. CER19 TaxID=3038538 RepID=UPI00244C664B|nr:hypothetical protein [Nocardioides sp. CER19]MDH2413378.1 hypothetical protein [Nocardioides sp. CER19]